MKEYYIKVQTAILGDIVLIEHTRASSYVFEDDFLIIKTKDITDYININNIVSVAVTPYE